MIDHNRIYRFFEDYPYPLYMGTPLANDTMRRYMADQVIAQAEKEPHNFLDLGVALAQWSYVDFLSERLSYYGDKENIYSLTLHSKMQHTQNAVSVGWWILEKLRTYKPSLIILNMPMQEYIYIQEEIGLCRAEGVETRVMGGFINYAGPTQPDDLQIPDHISITRAQDSNNLDDDLSNILSSYWGTYYDGRLLGHLVESGQIHYEEAVQLYAHNMENNINDVLIAKVNGSFGGAIIVGVDDNLYQKTGIKTNRLSGMGLIVNPRVRRMGVGEALLRYRQKMYYHMGVEWVSFGTHLSNSPMQALMGKIGLRPVLTQTTAHLFHTSQSVAPEIAGSWQN